MIHCYRNSHLQKAKRGRERADSGPSSMVVLSNPTAAPPLKKEPRA